MRKGYWIIIVFVAWCVVCAIWYMFNVKGLPPDTSIEPRGTTIAIVEILIMMTGAFFLGFGLAWMMRTAPLDDAMDELRNARHEMHDLQRRAEEQADAAANWENRAKAAEDAALSGRITIDELSRKISALGDIEDQQRKKLREFEAKVHQIEGEVTSARFRIRVLEGDLEEKAKALGRVADELNEAGTKPPVQTRDWSDHPFVRPVDADPDERDDLTEIKGIGPAFQKKLYSLDIYTFRQISELSGEGVEHLADVIEVFPDRIHRDNWIGQATKLYLKKIGKEV